MSPYLFSFVWLDHFIIIIHKNEWMFTSLLLMLWNGPSHLHPFISEGDPRIHHNYKFNLLHMYCNKFLGHTWTTIIPYEQNKTFCSYRIIVARCILENGLTLILNYVWWWYLHWSVFKNTDLFQVQFMIKVNPLSKKISHTLSFLSVVFAFFLIWLRVLMTTILPYHDTRTQVTFLG